MKVAVYAVQNAGAWSPAISLNLTVDQAWWSGSGTEHEGWNGIAADRLVILSSALPLGWAVKLRDSFRVSAAMKTWGADQWGAYMSNVLDSELRNERQAGGGWSEEELGAGVTIWRLAEAGWKILEQFQETVRLESEGRKPLEHSLNNARERGGRRRNERGRGSVGEGNADGAMDWFGVGERFNWHTEEVEQLVQAMAGRSLLQPELETLLAERLPGLAGHWRSVAQLAHLQGRLKLEAAVSSAGAPASSARLKAAARLPAGAGRLLRTAAACLPLLRLPGSGGFARRRATPRCLRCGSAVTGRTACAACGLAGCAYCEACLALGRSRACALLLRSTALPAVRYPAGPGPTAAAGRWGLSAAQAGAARAALGFLAERRERSAVSGPERFLLWAVTGAGKTEITFPLLEAVLAAGGRALVATPRRDVVLELAPRLAKAFPAQSLAVLYGGSPRRWASGDITLATTHQLLRFHQGFDLVIIDELDAFPYHNDPMLAFAAEQACKPDGSFIFLSATPPKALQRLARAGKLPHARVPVRFHGHPLPVPRHLNMAPVQLCLQRRRLPEKLLQALHKSLVRKAQIFVFVSRIAHIEGLLSLLRRSFPGVAIAGTSSQDPARAEKVTAFRDRSIALLVTTTILERGVTVPRSDVFILDADSRLFDEASLVQMAGRAGRSKDDPSGTVVFASSQWSRSQRGAISQIRTMNRIARRQGYIGKGPSL